MKIEMIKNVGENPREITFFVERERGRYNNCRIDVTLEAEDMEGLKTEQINQLAWNLASPTAYRVFGSIEPLDEPERFLGFKVAPLPVAPTEPTQMDVENFLLELEFRVLALEMGVNS